MKYLRFMAAMAVCVTLPMLARAETIGVAMKTFDSVYLSQVRNAIVDEANNQGVTTQLADAKLDPARQIEQVQSFADKGVSAIIINLAPGATMEQQNQIAQIAATANIPLVFVTVVPDLDSYEVPFAFVASNELVAGRLQMRKAGDLMHGQGKVFLMKGRDKQAAAVLRVQGGQQVLQGYPGISVVGQAFANWSRDEARKIMTDWLSKGNKVDAVIASNDEMAMGVIEAYQSLNIPTDNVIFGGVDATKDALGEIQKGVMAFTVLQNGAGQGKKAMDDAIKLARGEIVPEYDWVPYELISDKNLDEYTH